MDAFDSKFETGRTILKSRIKIGNSEKYFAKEMQVGQRSWGFNKFCATEHVKNSNLMTSSFELYEPNKYFEMVTKNTDIILYWHSGCKTQEINVNQQLLEDASHCFRKIFLTAHQWLVVYC